MTHNQAQALLDYINEHETSCREQRKNALSCSVPKNDELVKSLLREEQRLAKLRTDYLAMLKTVKLTND